MLKHHPDNEFASLVINGVRDGFKIGYDYAPGRIRKGKSRNLGSAYEHPHVVTEYLNAELRSNRILGPFPSPTVPLHASNFSVIPKRHQPGKWRLILDFSSPEGYSIDDGIDGDACSLS